MPQSTSRARGIIAASVAALAAVALAGPAAAAVPEPPGLDRAAKDGLVPARPLRGPEGERLERQGKLLPIARRLNAQARAEGSDIAGVALDVEHGIVHLYRTDTSLPTRAGDVPAGVEVTVHRARFDRHALNDAAGRVTRDARALADARVTVQAVGPAVDGSGIDVSVLLDEDRAGLDEATRVLHGRYGEIIGDVHGVKRQTSEKDLFFGGWRFNDFAPWYGGDRIRSSSGGCSTGFAAVYNGAPAALTAAHCGGVGTAFSNGPRSDNTFRAMGSMVYSDARTDVGAIGVTSHSNYINVGSALSPTQLYVGSWATPIVGQYLCQSGSYTGEVCALRVVDTAQQVCRGWFLWWCTSWQGPLADVVNAAGSGSYAAGYGDSGGPVYLRTSGSGIAEGLVHGVLTPNAEAAYPAYAPVSKSCPSPEGWSVRCSSGFSFAHMPGY